MLEFLFLKILNTFIFLSLILKRIFLTFLLIILVVSMPFSIMPLNIMNVQATTESDEEVPPPEIAVPDEPVVEEATGPQGAEVEYTVTATNATGAPVDVTCNPTSGTVFALGTTTVECTALDSTGNEAVETFEVIVQDTTPPTSEIGVVKTDWMGLINEKTFGTRKTQLKRMGISLSKPSRRDCSGQSCRTRLRSP